MKVHFLGGARTTTGSMYLLEVNQKRILLECGLYQGRRAEAEDRNRHFTFDPRSLDAVILSHAHIDHTGNLPNLCAQGYEGNVYCTFATRDLSAIMLADSAAVQAADAEFLSRQRAKQGLPAVKPLYSAADVQKAIECFVGVNYRRKMTIAPGVAVTFRD
ncbi:MAG TPA: MBL fold metallo-hydrolase, partial [Candidatus Limnocylindria bacterium]|nr:MBL fold metallo-hydrolase [Candidatus Limnocylindria bacterium]